MQSLQQNSTPIPTIEQIRSDPKNLFVIIETAQKQLSEYNEDSVAHLILTALLNRSDKSPSIRDLVQSNPHNDTGHSTPSELPICVQTCIDPAHIVQTVHHSELSR